MLCSIPLPVKDLAQQQPGHWTSGSAGQCLSPQRIFQIGDQSLASAEIRLFLDATLKSLFFCSEATLALRTNPLHRCPVPRHGLEDLKASWCWEVCGREGVGWSLPLKTPLQCIIISFISKSRSECTQTYTHMYTCTLHENFRGKHNPSNIYVYI